MKGVYAVACGIGAFFAMNCGSGLESAYGGAPEEDKSATEVAVDGATVSVNGHTFDPPTLRVKAGSTVKWTWKVGRHNVVSGSGCSPDGRFNSGALQGPGTIYEHTFDKPGSYPYYCDPHCSMGMTGKVIVE